MLGAVRSAAPSVQTQTVMVSPAVALTSNVGKLSSVVLVLGYVHTPRKSWILEHLAPVGHAESWKQIKAQYLEPEAESCRAHCGWAVVPSGTSEGQAPVSQCGAQTEPSAP